MNREEVNEMLRNSFNDILNREPTEREKEIKEIARKEKEEYELVCLEICPISPPY